MRSCFSRSRARPVDNASLNRSTIDRPHASDMRIISIALWGHALCNEGRSRLEIYIQRKRGLMRLRLEAVRPGRNAGLAHDKVAWCYESTSRWNS